MHELNPDAVPFPFRCVIGHVDHRLFQRMGEHEGPEQRHVSCVGRFAALRPGEQFGIGRGQPVPIFLHIVDRHVESLGECDLAESR